MNATIRRCDSQIKFYEEKQQYLPYKQSSKKVLSLWSEYFIAGIKFHRLMKLVVQAVLKYNKILLPILKERYANALVENMFVMDNCVKENILPERMYLEFCKNIGKYLTNDIYELIDAVTVDEDKKPKSFIIEGSGGNIEIIIHEDVGIYEHDDEDSSEEEEQEEEEEQAPEPIYDVNPNATDVEICASFTNLLS